MASSEHQQTPQKAPGAGHFLSPASALSEALGRHRFEPGDRVRWEKSAISHTHGETVSASSVGRGYIVGVVESAPRLGVDPLSGKSSTIYRVHDDDLGRECLLSSAALRREKH